MARLGRLGNTITEATACGFRVSSACGSFRGATFLTNGVVMVNLEGKMRKFSGTLKGAVRRLRRLVHDRYELNKVMMADLDMAHDAMMQEINEQRIEDYVRDYYTGGTAF